jgi:N-acetylmuramate 1-kinase
MKLIKEKWKGIIESVLSPETISQVDLITGGGSKRCFYRIRAGKRSFILQEAVDKTELDQYVRMGKYLAKGGISVPALLSGSVEEGLALFTDAGDESLYSIVSALLKRGDLKKVASLYRKTIRELLKIQRLKISNAPDFLKSRIFDFEHYRWESDYFREKCAGDVFGIQAICDPFLTAELEELAKSLVGEPRFLVHRDFQSKNVQVKGNKIYILDYQSARQGSPFYDLASLLKDPYVELPQELQKELFEFYVNNFYMNEFYLNVGPASSRTKELQKHEIRSELSLDKAVKIYNRAALQRLMQALGAYGKLGLDDGKTEFLQYIPPALRLLNETLENAGGFSRLRSLVSRIMAQATGGTPLPPKFR